MMKVNTNTIVEKLQENYPDQTIFRKAVIVDTAKSLGFSKGDWSPLLSVKSDIRGQYDLSSVIVPLRQKEETNTSTLQMQSIVNQEKSYATADPTFVPWGPFKDITKVIQSEMFYPVYISGLSGNGKTFMVEQSCAKLNREFIRVQINPETDEDDLIGGFRLIDGETVFAKGPVLKAMENGAVLLLDEIDRATNKIMCLQGILEGKPVVVKKTGETISPAPGFNVSLLRIQKVKVQMMVGSQPHQLLTKLSLKGSLFLSTNSFLHQELKIKLLLNTWKSSALSMQTLQKT